MTSSPSENVPKERYKEFSYILLFCPSTGCPSIRYKREDHDDIWFNNRTDFSKYKKGNISPRALLKVINKSDIECPWCKKEEKSDGRTSMRIYHICL